MSYETETCPNVKCPICENEFNEFSVQVLFSFYLMQEMNAHINRCLDADSKPAAPPQSSFFELFNNEGSIY